MMIDRYDLPFSIKDDERDRRAAKYPNQGQNVFPKARDTFPSAADFSVLMTNGGHKTRLQMQVKVQSGQGKQIKATNLSCKRRLCVLTT
jgi:hypothetical protein